MPQTPCNRGHVIPIDETPPSFYWYDLETSGIDPASDRIMQFAGCRTDVALQPIGEPFVTYIRLAADVLPSPEACLVTGILPQSANAQGLDEWQALTAIDEELRQPNTCVLGYNNLRFDDHFLRHGFYRNLLDPYAREWQDGNSRWDLIDVVRAACALRPDGLRWPSDDGVVSFKLERLSVENGIVHRDPHDALADVTATLELGRLLKSAQPRLWDFAFRHRSRDALRNLLFPLGKRLCLHVSQQFSNERRCAAPVTALAIHPEIGNRVIVADLARDISPLIECDASELRERLFAPRSDHDDAEEPSLERPPLKAVVLNRCPFVAPISAVRPEDAARLGFDLAEVESRRKQLEATHDLAEKIADAYRRDQPSSPPGDAELSLYDGFTDDADKRTLERLQLALAAKPEGWPAFSPKDERLRALGERLKARLRPEQLTGGERERWQEHVSRCLQEGFGARPSLATFKNEANELLAAESDEQRRRFLRDLTTYATAIEQAQGQP